MKNTPENENIVTKYTKAAIKKQMSIDFSDLKLTKPELIFVIVYCTNGFKSTDAMEAAGYKAPTRSALTSKSWHVHNQPNVRAAINRIIQSATKPYTDKIGYKVIEAYYLRAFYRLEDFYEDDGTLRPLSKLPEALKELVDGMTTRYYGKDANIKVREYVLPNRDTALQSLGRIAWGGNNGGDQDVELPAEIRSTLAQIRKNVQNSPVPDGSKVTTTYTATQTIESGKRKPGRPRKVETEIEVRLP